FVAARAGLAWSVACWWARRRQWDWSEQMPLVVMVSFLTACYGAWPFDLVVLLLPIMQAAVWTAERPSTVMAASAIGCYVAIDGLALAVNLLPFPSFWFVWM